MTAIVQVEVGSVCTVTVAAAPRLTGEVASSSATPSWALGLGAIGLIGASADVVVVLAGDRVTVVLWSANQVYTTPAASKSTISTPALIATFLTPLGTCAFGTPGFSRLVVRGLAGFVLGSGEGWGVRHFGKWSLSLFLGSESSIYVTSMRIVSILSRIR